LEKAIRRPIDPEVRSKIEEINYDYLTLATWEETATPASSVIKDVEVIKSATVKYRNALLLKDGFQARHEIETELGLPRGALRDEALGLRARVRGCDAVVGRLNAQEGYVPGEAWDRWIGQLARALKAAGLPTKARKDKDGTSPFVMFIAVLQDLLPAKFRRHTKNHTALAAAINKARRNSGTL
jgi:hypothetical protein